MRYNWIDEYLLSKKGVNKNPENRNWIRYQIEEKMFAAVCCDEEGVPYCFTLKLQPDDLLKDLLDKSYSLVLAGFSKRKQAEVLAE